MTTSLKKTEPIANWFESNLMSSEQYDYTYIYFLLLRERPSAIYAIGFTSVVINLTIY